jgi:hypothetical protein
MPQALLDDGVIELKTQERAERVLAPKLDGTRVLERIAARLSVRFLGDVFVRKRILAARWPSGLLFGQCVLERLRRRAAEPARNVIAIGWSAWGEVGMAVAGKEARSAFSPSHPLIESLEVGH